MYICSDKEENEVINNININVSKKTKNINFVTNLYEIFL